MAILAGNLVRNKVLNNVYFITNHTVRLNCDQKPGGKAQDLVPICVITSPKYKPHLNSTKSLKGIPFCDLIIFHPG